MEYNKPVINSHLSGSRCTYVFVHRAMFIQGPPPFGYWWASCTYVWWRLSVSLFWCNRTWRWLCTVIEQFVYMIPIVISQERNSFILKAKLLSQKQTAMSLTRLKVATCLYLKYKVHLNPKYFFAGIYLCTCLKRIAPFCIFLTQILTFYRL